MLDTEMYEAAAAVPAAAALAANRRRVVATGNRASAERAAPQPLEGRWRGEAAAPRPCRLRSPPGSGSHPRPAIPSGCDARRAALKELSGRGCRCLGSVKSLVSSANATWQPWLEDWGLFQSAGVGGGRGLPSAPAASFPGSESALPATPASELGPAKDNRARTRLALAPRPFVLHSISTSRFGGFSWRSSKTG